MIYLFLIRSMEISNRQPPPPHEALSCSVGKSVGIRPWFMTYWFLGEGVSNAEWGKAGGAGGTLILPISHTGSVRQAKRASCPGRPSPAWLQPIPGGRSGPLLMAHEHTRWERVLPPFILGPYHHCRDRSGFEWDTLIWQAGPHTWLVVV